MKIKKFLIVFLIAYSILVAIFGSISIYNERREKNDVKNQVKRLEVDNETLRVLSRSLELDNKTLRMLLSKVVKKSDEVIKELEGENDKLNQQLNELMTSYKQGLNIAYNPEL